MATNTISTAAGDGGLSVTVNEFGEFSSNQALYDPLGDKTSASTTYRSYIALGVIGSDGNTGARNSLSGLASFNGAFTDGNNSTFTINGLQFQLKQTAQDLLNSSSTRTGSRFDQTYTVTNTTNQAINFDLVRYVDGDLLFDGSLVDGGGKFSQNGQDILFETDLGGVGQADTTFFGITGNGGTIPTTNRFELDYWSILNSTVLNGRAFQDRVIRGDGNSDQFIDSGAEYDVALGLRNVFSLSPGQSTAYTSTTRFGSGDLAQLDISVPTGGVETLPATTVGTTINVASGFGDLSGIRDYDGFVAVNEGGFTQWLTDSRAPSAVFTGEVGNTYTFYSLATDNAGNEQSADSAPRTTTRLVGTNPDTPPNPNPTPSPTGTTINGTPQSDNLTGTAGNNIINGFGGDDVLDGGLGDDQLFGGAGSDELYGGAGNDTLSGDAGDDGLYGGEGNDTLNGGLGNDELVGDAGDDILDGGDGIDDLYGSAGSDELYGGAGNDTLTGDAGDDGLYGGEGNDTLNGGLGNDELVGDAGDDILDGGDGIDDLYGSAGSDELYGGAGNDTLTGDAGDDGLYGGEGNDILNGGLGNDELVGDAGDDILDGGDGIDDLYGGAGSDELYGGVGNDTLSGEAGDDGLYGGEGNDTLNGGLGNDELVGDAGDDILDGGDGIDDLYGSAGSDELYGGAGNDTLTGEAGDDGLYGGEGNDTLNGGLGNDELVGDAGDDILDGGDGIDDLYGSAGSDELYGDAGNDTLTGDAGDDGLYGGEGNDILNGGLGNDELVGDEGIDVLYGGEGIDDLYGGEGNDILNGGVGNDILHGNGGANIFAFGSLNDGVDTIVDFSSSQDKLLFSATSFGGGLSSTVPLNSDQFVTGSAATNTSQRFIYDISNGNLYFDVDGIGGAGQVQIATLSNLSSLSANNFAIA